MKIRELHLTAFGPFTEKVLDFSEGNFQIVFGPNEAGKSSALRAISNFLYGIPARSTDNFVHDNKLLRIGAKLECSDGRTRFFVRRKGNKDTLLDGDGNACSDGEIEPFLGQVKEELFLHMFGISHQRLIDGGREIVEGKGDVGQSIFAAGLGVIGLRKLLETLSQQEGELFKPSGQNPEINRLVSACNATKQDLRALSLSAKAYHDAAAELATAEGRRDELGASLAELVNRIDRLERLQKAAPRVAQLKAVRKDREGVDQGILLPEDFADRRARNQNERQRAVSDVTALEVEIGEIRAKIDSHPVDNRLLVMEREILDLVQSQGAYSKNQTDLPGLKHKRHNLREEAQRLLRKLGLPEDLDQAEKLRLSNPQKATIGAATDHLKSLRQQIGSVETQGRESEKEIGDLQAKLATLSPVRPVDGLQGALKLAVIEGDLTRQRDELVAEWKSTEGRALRKFSRLVPHLPVELDTLETLAVPSSETIKRFDAEEAAMKQGSALLEGQVRELEERREKVLLRMDAVKKGTRVPTEQDLDAQRDRRDHGWRLVRQSWEKKGVEDEEIAAFASERPLAEAYEHAVRDADQVADELRRESDRVAQLQELAGEQQRLEQQLIVKRQELDERSVAQSVWNAEWLQVWASAGIEPLSPAEMKLWRVEYDGLVEMCGTARDLLARRDHLETKMEQLRLRLLEEGGKIGLDGWEENLSLAELIVRSEEAIELIQRQNGEYLTTERDLAQATRQSDRVRAAIAELRTEEKKARNVWGKTVTLLGLCDTSGIEEAQVVLTDIGDVFQKLDEAEVIQGRVIGIEKDCRSFEARVRELAERLEEDATDRVPPQERISRLHQRLTEARANSTLLKNLSAQCDEKERQLSRSRRRVEELNSIVKNLLIEAGVESEDEFPAVEAASARIRTLDQTFERIREQLVDYAGGGTVEEFIVLVEEIDPESLPGQIEQHKLRKTVLTDEQTRLNESVGVLRKNLAALDGSAAAAVKAEELEGSLAALRLKTEEYARVRLASVLLRREIERYRQKHQGPVLKRAGELFTRLTLGSFDGLATDFDDKDEQVLVGRRPGGDLVRVEGMSSGTCDQLYLALRLASLEHHNATSESMPLILDDILVNFDDARARATLEILNEVACANQIIYFTHHRHILELARSLPSGFVPYVHSLVGEEDADDAVSGSERFQEIT